MIELALNGNKKRVSLKRNDDKTDFQNNWLFFRKRVYTKIPLQPLFSEIQKVYCFS